jgi:hypothetical protein
MHFSCPSCVLHACPRHPSWYYELSQYEMSIFFVLPPAYVQIFSSVLCFQTPLSLCPAIRARDHVSHIW